MLRCGRCDFETEKRSNLTRHIKRRHPGNDLPDPRQPGPLPPVKQPLAWAEDPLDLTVNKSGAWRPPRPVHLSHSGQSSTIAELVHREHVLANELDSLREKLRDARKKQAIEETEKRWKRKLEEREREIREQIQKADRQKVLTLKPKEEEKIKKSVHTSTDGLIIVEKLPELTVAEKSVQVPIHGSSVAAKLPTKRSQRDSRDKFPRKRIRVLSSSSSSDSSSSSSSESEVENTPTERCTVTVERISEGCAK